MPIPPDARLLSGMSVLVAVVEAGSFARAAGALGLTPSGISRAVARLETRVGVRLFDRSSRAVALTGEGRRFYEQVAPLLVGIEEAASHAGGAATAARGRLRVNVDPTVACWLHGRLGTFLASNPGISLEMVVSHQVADLVADGFDVAVRFGAPEPSSLVTRLLLRTRVATCAAPAYLERQGRPAHPRELGDGRHECILFRYPGMDSPAVWEFRRGKERLEVPVSGRLTLNDAAAHLAACIEGQGIAQILDLGACALATQGKLVRLFEEWEQVHIPMHVVHPSRRLRPAKVRAFLDFIAATVEVLPWSPG
jgi:DNA-binding transcriptional LysR family regulator